MFLNFPHDTEAIFIQRDRRQRYRILGFNKENSLSQTVRSMENLVHKTTSEAVPRGVLEEFILNCISVPLCTQSIYHLSTLVSTQLQTGVVKE